MDDVISKELFDELDKTAMIGLSPEERESLRAEMNRQMAVIRLLETIPLDENIRPVIHGNPYPEDIRAGLREDVPVPFEDAAAIIAGAPRSREGYIVSPDVPHQILEQRHGSDGTDSH